MNDESLWRLHLQYIVSASFYLPCILIAVRLIFRQHCWQAILPIAVDVTVDLSVCLSRSCIVFKRQKISTRFILHMIASCLSQIVLKFGFHRSTPSSPNFAPKWHLLLWLVPSLSHVLPFPKIGVPTAHSSTKFATHAATWWIWKKSDVAFCQITLPFVFLNRQFSMQCK